MLETIMFILVLYIGIGALIDSINNTWQMHKNMVYTFN